jgi:hypothetical protein
MYSTSRHKEGRGNASNVQLAEQGSFKLSTLDDRAMMKLKVEQQCRPRECESPNYLRREHVRNPD